MYSWICSLVSTLSDASMSNENISRWNEHKSSSIVEYVKINLRTYNLLVKYVSNIYYSIVDHGFMKGVGGVKQ